MAVGGRKPNPLPGKSHRDGGGPHTTSWQFELSSNDAAIDYEEFVVCSEWSLRLRQGMIPASSGG